MAAGLLPFGYAAGAVPDLKSLKMVRKESVIIKKNTHDLISDKNGIYKLSQIFRKEKLGPIGFVSSVKDTLKNNSSRDNINELEEVVMVKEKSKTELFLDKKVIHVGKDLLSGGGDALTVLERVPEIQSDQDGNISLKGNQNVNVLINGKPSPLSTAELLRQIPSANIDKIEIITSPSAKYTADGLTGIVNIITNKKVASGVNITTSGSVNSRGGYNGDTNVTLGTGKLNYSFGMGYVKNKMKNKSVDHRENTDPIRIENDFKFNGDVYRASGKVDWFMNKSNEFSLGINYTDNGHDLFYDGVISQKNKQTLQKNLSSHIHRTFDLMANYKHIFNKPENYLELDLYVSNNTNLLKTEFEKNIGMADNRTDNSVVISRASADYNAKICSKVRLEAGILWERQRLDNEFSIFNGENSILSNRKFQNIQTTYASYGLLKFDFKKFNIQAGLRSEIFNRVADLRTDKKMINSNYINLFPSLHMGYNMDNGKMISLGFNRRTTRPTLEQVNPYTNQSNKFEIFEGSPDLRPEFSNNFDLNFQYKKAKFNVMTGISYQLREGIILNNFSVNENGITFYRPFNGGNSNAFGLDISSSVRILKGWDSKLFLNWNYESSAQRDVFLFRNFSTNYSLTLQNDIKLSDKMELGIAWKYNSAQRSYLSDRKENQNIDIALSHKIFSNKGSMTLRLTDIFNTRIFEGQNYGSGFVNTYRFKPQSRAAFLSFTYNIKSGKKLNERNIPSKDYKSGVMD